MSVFDSSLTVEILLASEHGADTKVDQDELNLCLELRTQVPDARSDQIIRFLRARKGNVAKAKVMLDKHLAWRQEMQLPLDPATDADLDEEVRKNKFVFHGKDNAGRPILVIRGFLLGKSTYKDMAVARRSVVHIMEHFENLNEPLAKAHVFFSKIGATSKNIDTDFMKNLADVFQNNYPERLHAGLVAPAGMLLLGIWQTVKWFVDSDIRKKYTFKLDAKVFTLLAPLEDLAEELGGNNPNPLVNHESVFRMVGADAAADDVVEVVQGMEKVVVDVLVVEGKPDNVTEPITNAKDDHIVLSKVGGGGDNDVAEGEKDNNIASTVDFSDAVAAAVKMGGSNNINEIEANTVSPDDIATEVV